MASTIDDNVATARSVGARLQAMACELGHCEVSTLDAQSVQRTIVAARRLERAVEAVLVRLAQRADALAADGVGPGATESLLGRGEVSARRARTTAARSRAATDLPAMDDVVASGAAGGEHLDSVARALDKLSDDERRDLIAKQEDLATAAARLPVDTFNSYVDRVVDGIRDDHGRRRAEQQKEESEFRHWRDPDGMGHFRGKLDPERFDAVIGAIDAQMRAMARAANGSAEAVDGHQAPTALDADLAAAALCALVTAGKGRRGRAHIKLIVDARTMTDGPHEHTVSETSFGTTISPDTLDRLACDAVIRKVMVDSGTVEVDVGRNHRTATDAQWAALITLYATCGWYGCDQPVDWCEAHHVRTWDDLGPTDLDNLVPLCTRHHHAVHEGRWRIRLETDRTLRIHTPDGRHWRTATPDRLEAWLRWRRSLWPPGDDGRRR